MVTFVLVGGAWLGSWAWDDVVPRLREAGHEARPLTLSGLAERSGVPAGQRTHVADIVDAVVTEDLRDVVLVGHSYSGIPVGQAAEQIGDRLRRVVYVDSDVAHDGGSFVTGWPDGWPMIEKAMAENAGTWPPPAREELAGHGLTEEQVDSLLARATPHPGRSLTEPAELAGSLGDLPTTYVVCRLDDEGVPPEVERLARSPRWEMVPLATGHWPMLSRPGELADLLLRAATEV